MTAVLTPTQGSTFTRVLQIVNTDGTSATDVFTSGSVLTSSLWQGQNIAAIFSPTVAWWTNAATQTGYDQGQVLITMNASDLTALDPAGEYLCQVYSTTATVQTCVIECRVKVSAAPGTAVIAPPNLATYDYVEAALGAFPLSSAQRAFVPYATAAASNEIRRWCMDRDFTQTTYTGKIFPVALDGYIRLAQIPVNQVLRIQANISQAIQVSNVSSSVQFSQCLFAYTGDVASGQVITGLKLNWTSNGTPSTTTLAFTTGETINDLATAINGVGSGWQALADTTLGAWPVTELYDGYLGTGASANVIGQQCLYVFSDDLAGAAFHPDDGQLTGLVWVGRQYSGLGPQWGPYPMDSDWQSNALNIVKVSYNAGFATIPAIVQLATAEAVKVMLQRMKLNPYLVSETAGEYKYELTQSLMQALPPYILQELSAYRLTNA